MRTNGGIHFPETLNNWRAEVRSQRRFIGKDVTFTRSGGLFPKDGGFLSGSLNDRQKPGNRKHVVIRIIVSDAPE